MSINFDEQLSPKSTATVGWLQTKLQAYLKTQCKFKSCTVSDIGQTMGFMAQIKRVQIQWQSSTTANAQMSSPLNSVIVKLPTDERAVETLEAAAKQNPKAKQEQIPSNQNMIRMMHGKECNVYQWFQPEPPVKVPKIYYMNGDLDDTSKDNPAAIIMEDLTSYKIIDIIDGFNRNQLLEIFKAVADLHAHTMKKADRNWLNELKWRDDTQMREKFPQMLGGMTEVLKQIRPDIFLPLIDRFMAKFDCANMFSEFEQKILSGEVYPVLVHGDLWSANMLFDGDRLVSIIDWQLTHPGSAAEDLLRVLATCLPVESRRSQTKQLLQHYYQSLCRKLISPDDERAMATISSSKKEEEEEEEEQKPPFSFKEFLQIYEDTLPYTAMMSIIATVMWMNSPVVAGPDKMLRINELMNRLRGIVEDALETTSG